VILNPNVREYRGGADPFGGDTGAQAAVEPNLAAIGADQAGGWRDGRGIVVAGQDTGYD